MNGNPYSSIFDQITKTAQERQDPQMGGTLPPNTPGPYVQPDYPEQVVEVHTKDIGPFMGGLAAEGRTVMDRPWYVDIPWYLQWYFGPKMMFKTEEEANEFSKWLYNLIATAYEEALPVACGVFSATLTYQAMRHPQEMKDHVETMQKLTIGVFDSIGQMIKGIGEIIPG